MKLLIKKLAVCAITTGLVSSALYAGEKVKDQPEFRCTSCGAKYRVETKVGKDNALQIKMEQVAAAANPKTP